MEEREFFGDWCEVIDFDILNKILNTLGVIIQKKEIGPAPEDLFKAFGCCPYSELQVVMLGQDPYPQRGIATGIAFANKRGSDLSKMSPSLKVLFDAVEKYCVDDLPFSTIDETFPDLKRWCEQGILMLNSALSVEIGNIGSHQSLWRPFTESLLRNLQEKKEDLIFVMMGEIAQSFSNCVKKENIIKCPHPAKCARTGEEFPDIFKEVDKMVKQRSGKLIYWF